MDRHGHGCSSSNLYMLLVQTKPSVVSKRWLTCRETAPQLRPFCPCQRADVRRTKLLQGWNPISGAVISVIDCINATSALFEPVPQVTHFAISSKAWILWFKKEPQLENWTLWVPCFGSSFDFGPTKVTRRTPFDSNHWLRTHHAFPVFGKFARARASFGCGTPLPNLAVQNGTLR